MKSTAAMVALMGVVSAREATFTQQSSRMNKRQVPGEHAHQDILNIVNPILKANNPLEIQDVVFALLGNKAAAEGAPNVDNLDCLQQIVADQVFSNAKADNDLEGMANAIIFRSLERNTGSVGLASVLCNEQAENAEIAAITQHQDPASAEASGNAQIEINVAIQLASIGADPLLALGGATFPPGEIGDPTGKGFACDDANDDNGCINTLGLLTPAASEADITAAVDAAGAGNNNQAASKADDSAACAASQSNAGASSKQNNQAAAEEDAGAADEDAGASATATQGVNVQTFTGDLGGPPPAVVSSQADPKRNFAVDGSTFVNAGAALQRSCAVQHTKCANGANSGSLDVEVSDCDAQQADCNAAAGGGAAKRFIARKQRRQANVDFGSCGSPAISFGPGNDGRKEDSFIAVNQDDFNHGSALNIKVISGFNCDRLASNCDAPDDTVALCDQAAAAANGEKGQAAADAFNSVLGVSA